MVVSEFTWVESGGVALVEEDWEDEGIKNVLGVRMGALLSIVEAGLRDLLL